MRLTDTQQRALDATDPAEYLRRAHSAPPSPSALADAIEHAAQVEAEREAELQEQWEAEERETAARRAAERSHLRAA